jgi:hypothetical protein
MKDFFKCPRVSDWYSRGGPVVYQGQLYYGTEHRAISALYNQLRVHIHYISYCICKHQPMASQTCTKWADGFFLALVHTVQRHSGNHNILLSDR